MVQHVLAQGLLRQERPQITDIITVITRQESKNPTPRPLYLLTIPTHGQPHLPESADEEKHLSQAAT